MIKLVEIAPICHQNLLRVLARAIHPDDGSNGLPQLDKKFPRSLPGRIYQAAADPGCALGIHVDRAWRYLP